VTEERKQEVITVLQGIYDSYMPITDPTDPYYEPELTMYGLILRYNSTGQNAELISGQWVIENCPEPLCGLPS
jgi:hypothetical protein